jgi:GMP synthase (glutamine-hydrolysing)
VNTILILDFGSQTTQLIARRIRDLGVYTKIIPGNTVFSTETLDSSIKGIILSGSPESVYDKGAILDRTVYISGLPMLGICYGLHRMVIDLGGEVSPLPTREYGRISVKMKDAGNEMLGAYAVQFLNGFKPSFSAWMSHGDTATKLPVGFMEYGTSDSSYPAVVIHESKPWFGLQFHPEVTHCAGGSDILSAFIYGVCMCKTSWTMEHYFKETSSLLKTRIGNVPVLLLISGGVDSTVAGALLLNAIDRNQIHLMYIDTGLMRKNETTIVRDNLKNLGAKHVHIIHSEDEVLAALKGISDPEAKRKIIGDLFITIQEREVTNLGLPKNYFLAQGTLYTDLIESGKGVGNSAHLIKSHHNVGSPLVEAKRRSGKLIEPLDELYKDEVRKLGHFLNVDEAIVNRQPFPGPGLAVRILGEVTKQKCDILREADAIFLEELNLRKSPAGRSLYDEIWQAFAVLLPVRSVGVTGDARKYGWVLALRAITAADGMSADVYPFETRDLLEISTRITNSVPDIGRVVYDISSKPPATIEWE